MDHINTTGPKIHYNEDEIIKIIVENGVEGVQEKGEFHQKLIEEVTFLYMGAKRAVLQISDRVNGLWQYFIQRLEGSCKYTSACVSAGSQILKEKKEAINVYIIKKIYTQTKAVCSIYQKCKQN